MADNAVYCAAVAAEPHHQHNALQTFPSLDPPPSGPGKALTTLELHPAMMYVKVQRDITSLWPVQQFNSL